MKPLMKTKTWYSLIRMRHGNALVSSVALTLCGNFWFRFFEEGKCVYTSPSVMEIQSICTQEKATLWDENMRFVNTMNNFIGDQLIKLSLNYGQFALLN